MPASSEMRPWQGCHLPAHGGQGPGHSRAAVAPGSAPARMAVSSPGAGWRDCGKEEETHVAHLPWGAHWDPFPLVCHFIFMPALGGGCHSSWFIDEKTQVPGSHNLQGPEWWSKNSHRSHFPLCLCKEQPPGDFLREEVGAVGALGFQSLLLGPVLLAQQGHAGALLQTPQGPRPISLGSGSGCPQPSSARTVREHLLLSLSRVALVACYQALALTLLQESWNKLEHSV